MCCRSPARKAGMGPVQAAAGRRQTQRARTVPAPAGQRAERLRIGDGADGADEGAERNQAGDGARNSTRRDDRIHRCRHLRHPGGADPGRAARRTRENVLMPLDWPRIDDRARRPADQGGARLPCRPNMPSSPSRRASSTSSPINMRCAPSFASAGRPVVPTSWSGAPTASGSGSCPGGTATARPRASRCPPCRN